VLTRRSILEKPFSALYTLIWFAEDVDQLVSWSRFRAELLIQRFGGRFSAENESQNVLKVTGLSKLWFWKEKRQIGDHTLPQRGLGEKNAA
jgi:hypothetical protein